MILDGNTCAKPDIEYPCEWGYKIIGTDKIALQTTIFEIMEERDYSTKEGNSSRNGKFHTLNMRCVVSSQSDRDAIFKAFSDNENVKMVI